MTKKLTSEIFFVWCEGGTMPTHKHGNFFDAKAECERLAKKNKGKKFILLGALGAAFIPDEPSLFTEYAIDDLPF